MSLSNPREASPVRKYFRLKGGTGEVTNWDKAASQEVKHSLPFRFVVLDTLTTVGGFSESAGSGIYANEVRNTTTDILRVRTKNGVLMEGPYSEIKEKLKAAGGKYAASSYIAYKEGDEWALGNIQFIGASLSAWLDYTRGVRITSDPGVAITGFEQRTKGRTEYHVPTFERLKVSDETLAAAVELDKVLQEYLDGSLKARAEAIEQEVKSEDPWASVPASTQAALNNFSAEAPF